MMAKDYEWMIFRRTKGTVSSFATFVGLRPGKVPQHLRYRFGGSSQENLGPGVSCKESNWMELWEDRGGRKQRLSLDSTEGVDVCDPQASLLGRWRSQRSCVKQGDE